MRTFLLSLGCCFGLLAQAQQIRITPDTTGGDGSLYPMSFEVVSPDKYLVAGQLTLASDGYTEKGVLFECSKTGINWSKKLTSTFSSNAAIVAANGDRIEFGQKPGVSGLPDAYVSRFDAFGTLIWSVTLSTPAEEMMQTGIEAPNGSIYAIGKRRVDGYFQAFLVRLSGAGTLLWARQDAAASVGDQIPTDVFFISDTVLVAGQECIGAVKDFFIRTYDVNGNELLHKRFGSSLINEGIPSVTQTPDGGYAFYAGIFGDIKTVLLKIDAVYSPVPTSSYTLNRIGGGVLLATSVQADTDGSLYLGGAVVGATGYYGSVIRFSGGSVLWTSVLNTNGPVAAKVGFEGSCVIAPSIGFSIGMQGLVISSLMKQTGTIFGVPCESLNDASVIGVSSYAPLSETLLTPSVVDPGFVPTFGQPVVPYTFDIDDCGMEPLPIELVAWDALKEGSIVHLSWVTATEQENDHFTIERSSDGVTFEDVLRIEGAGNSTTQRRYDAVDEKPLSGVSYYRLRQTDWNGTQTVSEVVVVMMEKYSGMSCQRGVPVKTDEPTIVFDQSGRQLQAQAYVHVFDQIGVFILRGEATTFKVMVTD
jgi:hypothetical protein